jgi:hypothetical protein
MHRDALDEGRSLFEEQVIDQGMPTLASLGFALERSRPHLVRFASPDSFVEVFYDPRSLEVGIDIGLQRVAATAPAAPTEAQAPPALTIGRPVRRGVVSLDDVLRYACVSDADSGSFSFYTPQTLSEGLPRLMRTLARCGGPFLAGDRAAFARIQEASERDGHALMARMRNEDLRAAAARAWAAKDYVAVARALDSLGEERTPAEEAKLQYARGQTD